MGGYSLNYHKHIHTGEGGILVTNDSRIAERLAAHPQSRRSRGR